MIPVNIRNLPHGWEGNPEFVYFGRPTKGRKGFHYGNPFSHSSYPGIIRVADRNAAVDAHMAWLRGTAWQEIEPERREWILETLPTLKDKKYGACFCAPLRCHVENYIILLEELK